MDMRGIRGIFTISIVTQTNSIHNPIATGNLQERKSHPRDSLLSIIERRERIKKKGSKCQFETHIFSGSCRISCHMPWFFSTCGSCLFYFLLLFLTFWLRGSFNILTHTIIHTSICLSTDVWLSREGDLRKEWVPRKSRGTHTDHPHVSLYLLCLTFLRCLDPMTSHTHSHIVTQEHLGKSLGETKVKQGILSVMWEREGHSFTYLFFLAYSSSSAIIVASTNRASSFGSCRRCFCFLQLLYPWLLFLIAMRDDV